MSGLGLVDYSDDDSPSSSPARLTSNSLDIANNSPLPTESNPQPSTHLSGSPAKAEHPAKDVEVSANSDQSKYNNEATLESQNKGDQEVQPLSPKLKGSKVSEPPSVPRATPEEIRVKRNHMLYPEPWPDCPAWKLPLEPEGEIDAELQAKVQGYHDAMINHGVQFNERLQANQSFRNPHIYDKLVEFLGLNQTASNFPKEWFDPSGFPSSAHGHRLTEAQKSAARAKAAAQAANPRTSIPFVSSQAPSDIASSAIKRVLSSIDPPVTSNTTDVDRPRRRKSKWDMPGPTS